jgi:hypothetical protein
VNDVENISGVLDLLEIEFDKYTSDYCSFVSIKDAIIMEFNASGTLFSIRVDDTMYYVGKRKALKWRGPRQ